MKRILTMALALTMALSLAACGGKDNGSNSYETGVIQTIADAGAFSEELELFEEEHRDAVFLRYMLADSNLSQENLVEFAGMRYSGRSGEEVLLLVLDSEEHTRAAKEALETYVQKQIEQNKGYIPEAIPKLENAWIDVKGNTVLLVVADDLDAAKTAVGEQ